MTGRSTSASDSLILKTSSPGPSITSFFEDSRNLLVWLPIGIFGGGVVEELQRIFILTRFENWLGRPGLLLGVALTSAMFGFGHLCQGLGSAGSTAVSGLAFALVYLRRCEALEVVEQQRLRYSWGSGSQPSHTTRRTRYVVGRMVIVAFRPRPGQSDRLLELVREHVPILRAEGLATDRPAAAMRAADGSVVEVFEWKSTEAINAAHENPRVLAMWGRFAEASEYVQLTDLAEAHTLFAGFEPVDL